MQFFQRFFQLRNALLGFRQRLIACGQVFLQRSYAIFSTFGPGSGTCAALGQHNHIFRTCGRGLVVHARGNLALGGRRSIGCAGRGFSHFLTIAVPVSGVHTHFLRGIALGDGGQLLALRHIQNLADTQQIDIVVDEGIRVGTEQADQHLLERNPVGFDAASDAAERIA